MDIFEETAEFYRRAETEKRIIGVSVLGREIFALKIGEGRPVGIAQYAIHGREWITAGLAFAHFEYGLPKGAGSVWMIPLVNPDGALLSQCGLKSVENEKTAEFLRKINEEHGGKDGGEDFSLWKANARGVDLNVNFDADWGMGKRNIRTPASENYIGETPFSEAETIALRDFTLKIRPDYTVSYHTKGEEIYWYYYQRLKTCARDKRLAEAISRSTGYPLCFAKGSAGGYKDWCISRFHIPAFTVEAGNDNFIHPLGIREGAFEDIKKKNLRVISDLAETFVKTLPPSFYKNKE